MIHARGLVKNYGDLRAVDGLDLQIERGEIFGLLGPNGAGKSTTIGMLVGALRPDAGSVELAGRGDPALAATRVGLGVAPQNLSLYEELTGAENLRFFGRLQGVPERRLVERVAWALEFAGLEEKASKRVRTYSGGMQRRLNLVAAVIHEPEVLFLDEPTAGVDPQSRARLFDNIEALKAGGTTVLYTTHHMEEAERLCDRVAIMDHGRILDHGSVAELIERHGGTSQVTARLTASPPAGAESPGEIVGEDLSFFSQAPLDDLMALSRKGWPLSDFKVSSPNLESAFLKLTGRRLRD